MNLSKLSLARLIDRGRERSLPHIIELANRASNSLEDFQTVLPISIFLTRNSHTTSIPYDLSVPAHLQDVLVIQRALKVILAGLESTRKPLLPGITALITRCWPELSQTLQVLGSTYHSQCEPSHEVLMVIHRGRVLSTKFFSAIFCAHAQSFSPLNLSDSVELVDLFMASHLLKDIGHEDHIGVICSLDALVRWDDHSCVVHQKCPHKTPCVNRDTATRARLLELVRTVSPQMVISDLLETVHCFKQQMRPCDLPDLAAILTLLCGLARHIDTWFPILRDVVVDHLTPVMRKLVAPSLLDRIPLGYISNPILSSWCECIQQLAGLITIPFFCGVKYARAVIDSKCLRFFLRADYWAISLGCRITKSEAMFFNQRSFITGLIDYLETYMVLESMLRKVNVILKKEKKPILFRKYAQCNDFPFTWRTLALTVESQLQTRSAFMESIDELHLCGNMECKALNMGTYSSNFICAGCKYQIYCSRKCQAADWKTRHKDTCMASKACSKKDCLCGQQHLCSRDEAFLRFQATRTLQEYRPIIEEHQAKGYTMFEFEYGCDTGILRMGDICVDGKHLAERYAECWAMCKKEKTQTRCWHSDVDLKWLAAQESVVVVTFLRGEPEFGGIVVMPTNVFDAQKFIGIGGCNC